MSETTKIQWCDSTWNPWRGCTKVSAGCANCYADRMCNRFGIKFGRGELRVMSKPATFNAPLRWNKRPWVCDECGKTTDDPGLGHHWTPELGCASKLCRGYTFRRRRVFLGSLMDIFDPEVPAEWLARVLDMVRRCDQLDWMFVTKRPEMFESRMGLAMDRATKHSPGGDAVYSWLFSWLDGNPPPNVTIIATVENQEMADKRIPELLGIPVLRCGLSIEPLLGPVDIRQQTGEQDWDWPKIDWVIVGGESGPKARPCNVEWIRSIVQQCAAAEVPCFVKQLGSNPVFTNDNPPFTDHCPTGYFRDKKGSDPSEWPVDLRVRQWMKDRE